MEPASLAQLERQVALLSREDQLALAAWVLDRLRAKRPSSPAPIEWTKYSGILKHGPDPLEYQTRVREEWE